MAILNLENFFKKPGRPVKLYPLYFDWHRGMFFYDITRGHNLRPIETTTMSSYDLNDSINRKFINGGLLGAQVKPLYKIVSRGVFSNWMLYYCKLHYLKEQQIQHTLITISDEGEFCTSCYSLSHRDKLRNKYIAGLKCNVSPWVTQTMCQL